ncbi:MAG: multicopper oxidase domain-containing protein [Calditrichia bacterium]
MLPGQVTRVIAKFDRPGRYVWHCHILCTKIMR